MAAKLSLDQDAVLACLGARDIDCDGALSAHEISYAMGHRSQDWARAKLVALERHGYALKHGWTFSNARTWTITEAGRSALADRPSQGGDSDG